MSDFDIVGGAYGIEAKYDDMELAARLIAGRALDAGEVAAKAHLVMVDPDLAASAVLSPGTFAAVEAALARALDGTNGLTASSVRMTAAAIQMRAAAETYQAKDRALAALAEGLQQTTGAVAGLAAPALLASPVTWLVGGVTLERQGFFDDKEAWLVAHPDLVEQIAGSGGSAVGTFASNLLGLRGPVFISAQDAAGLFSLIYDQGEAEIEQVGAAPDSAPRDLGAALGRLGEVGADSGQFAIEEVVVGDEKRYNVYLPGTDAERGFDTPWSESGLIQNMGTNFAAVAGLDNAYSDAVRKALADRCVPQGSPINFIGHSQGGIEAMRLAQEFTDGEGLEYNVTSVITAGAPVDDIEVPENVKVLSLVNQNDIVARTDGTRFTDRSNHTTVLTSSDIYWHNGRPGDAAGARTVAGNHSVENVYQPLAEDLVATAVVEPEGEAGTALLGSQDFFVGGTDNATRYTYTMSRK